MEIKSCPFCGRKDKLVFTSRNVFEQLVNENGAAAFLISCNRCNVNLFEHDWECNDYKERKESAIIKWNTRRRVRRNETN